MGNDIIFSCCSEFIMILDFCYHVITFIDSICCKIATLKFLIMVLILAKIRPITILKSRIFKIYYLTKNIYVLYYVNQNFIEKTRTVISNFFVPLYIFIEITYVIISYLMIVKSVKSVY